MPQLDRNRAATIYRGMRFVILPSYTTLSRLIQYVLVMAVMAFPAQAKTDPVKAFVKKLDGFSAEQKPFPEKFKIYSVDDVETSLAFGKDQPWRLINFWASWCAPCIKEMPSLKVLQDRAKNMKNFKVVLVSSDMPVNGKGLSYMIVNKNMPEIEAFYVKDHFLWQTFDLVGIPTSLLVSPEGKIAYTLMGDAEWDSPEAAAFFRAVLPPSVFP